MTLEVRDIMKQMEHKATTAEACHLKREQTNKTEDRSQYDQKNWNKK
jgi:hypothetical protein